MAYQLFDEPAKMVHMRFGKEVGNYLVRSVMDSQSQHWVLNGSLECLRVPDMVVVF